MHKVFGKQEQQQYLDRSGAYLIAIEHNKLAVVKTPKGYFLPGGGLENGESDVQCIKRECLEEIGCEVQVQNFVCSAEKFVQHPTLGYFHPIQRFYCGKIGEKRQLPKETDHHFEWLDWQKAQNSLFVDMQNWAVTFFLQNKSKG